LKLAAPIAIEAVAAVPTTLETIVFAMLGAEEFKAFREAADRVGR
jgi:hypothetical protein